MMLQLFLLQLPGDGLQEQHPVAVIDLTLDRIIRPSLLFELVRRGWMHVVPTLPDDPVLVAMCPICTFC